MVGGDPLHCAGYEMERCIPRDPLPSRIRVSLRPCPADWVREPVRVVDEFGRRPAFRAQRLPGGMREIGIEPGKAPISHGGDASTARDAEAAVALDAACDR